MDSDSNQEQIKAEIALRWVAYRSVPCPVCSAQIGGNCLNEAGLDSGGCHTIRIALAKNPEIGELDAVKQLLKEPGTLHTVEGAIER